MECRMMRNVVLEVHAVLVTKFSLFWYIILCNLCTVKDVSVEHIASILKVKKLAKQETSMKQAVRPATQCHIPEERTHQIMR
jgi:hypothetical protein